MLCATLGAKFDRPNFMTILKNRGLLVGVTAAALTTIGVTAVGMQFSKGMAFFRDSPKEIVDEVWNIVDRNYVDGTFNRNDWRAVRRQYVNNRNYRNKADAYKAIREMLKKLGDPYTRFMDPKEFRDMQVETSGQLVGVGIQLTQEVTKDARTRRDVKRLVVVAPIEDTPAARAGIQSRDIIIRIDNRDARNMDVNQAVQLIRGQEGTNVSITVLRGNQTVTYNLRRAQIEIHPVKYSYRPNELGGIGYIRLNQFSANAPQEMRTAIQNLERQGAKGYVLDLRGNPGGLLYGAIDIARMWLNEGVVVSTANRQGIGERSTANGTALTNRPLVVLVDKGSASASEILSGALQDNRRAVLVGEKTFGKGLVQSVRPLGDGSGLAVTIAKYFTPNRRDINKLGIEPDVRSILTNAQKQAIFRDRTRMGTPQDPQYAVAVNTLKARLAGQPIPSTAPAAASSPSPAGVPSPSPSSSP